MAPPSLSSLTLLFFLIACSAMLAEAQVEDTSGLSLEWPSSTHFTYPTYPFGADQEDAEDPHLSGPDPSTAEDTRRALFWHRMRYYISYGALSANRIPCPPRSGRSYYTHNCYHARGPAHPYSRGCSRITRCRM